VWGNFQYPRLRSVRFIIRKAMPNLFTFLDYPHCPNTTNSRGRMGQQRGGRSHTPPSRHYHADEKKTLVSIILSHLKRKARKEEGVPEIELSV
jgi:hypothetical protein